MHYTAQINGPSPSYNAHIARLLEQRNIAITHQHLEEFMVAPLQDKWERHEMVVDLLKVIARSSFHIVANERSLISTDMAVQILQAIRANRPIIFSELPDFADEVDTFTQRLIASRLHDFTITNLVKLTENQLRSALRHLITNDVDYSLSSTDAALASAKIRHYLRTLLVIPQVGLATELFAN